MGRVGREGIFIILWKYSNRSRLKDKSYIALETFVLKKLNYIT